MAHHRIDGMLTCPDCGTRTLRHIEDTEPVFPDEYKEIRCCDRCDTLVYIIRHPQTPEANP